MPSPCAIAKRNYSKLLQIATLTRRRKKEHSMTYCYRPGKKSLSVTGYCSGDECSVIAPKCPKTTALSGAIHTHPYFSRGAADYPTFSIQDYASALALGRKFNCVMNTSGLGICMGLKRKRHLTTQEKELLKVGRSLEAKLQADKGDAQDWDDYEKIAAILPITLSSRRAVPFKLSSSLCALNLTKRITPKENKRLVRILSERAGGAP